MRDASTAGLLSSAPFCRDDASGASPGSSTAASCEYGGGCCGGGAAPRCASASAGSWAFVMMVQVQRRGIMGSNGGLTSQRARARKKCKDGVQQRTQQLESLILNPSGGTVGALTLEGVKRLRRNDKGGALAPFAAPLPCHWLWAVGCGRPRACRATPLVVRTSSCAPSFHVHLGCVFAAYSLIGGFCTCERDILTQP